MTDTKSRESDRHFLFSGELSDAPGRDESWDEYVRYLGNNRWELIIEGTDFSGTSVAEPVKEVMSTKAIISWIQERDEEIEEGSTNVVDDQDELEDDGPRRQFGPRAERLREIAVNVGATYCVLCLDRWLAGSWPPAKQRVIRVLVVKGVARRGVWIGVYHNVYKVETNLGPGFLYPPNADRAAKLILESEGSMSQGRIVKISKALMANLEALRPCLESLTKQ